MSTTDEAPDLRSAKTVVDGGDAELEATLLLASGAGLDPTAAQRSLAAWAPTLVGSGPAATPATTFKSATQDGPAPGASLPPRASIVFPGAPADPTPDPAPADYVVHGELGRGGMGVVYEADQPTIGRRVAIKMMRGGRIEPRDEARFVGEARVTGRLEHPNIVPVYDLGRTRDARLFLGMKLVRGESWAALLRREPADGPERLRRHLEVLSAVCDAVAYAHACGFLHRDLKPENVMVGEFGEVQVMDWGLAVELGEGGRAVVTGEAGPCGTPVYMSPEQAGAEPGALGTWSDVYLLGALLYEVLTGAPPHRAPTPMAAVLHALVGTVEPPRAVAPPGREVPRDLEQLCLAALAKAPAARPAGARAFKEGLRQHLAHAEALRLVERARGLVAPEADDAALARAQVLLGQALELWPEAPDARALAASARLLEVDLSLERDDGRRALALLEALPEGDLPAERRAALAAAARRQVRRGRNRILAAVAIVLATGAGLAISEQRRVASEADEKRRVARRDLGRVTREAWDALEALDLDVARERVLKQREVAAEAGWAGESDDVALSTHLGWLALRAGEERRAVGALPEPWRGLVGKAMEGALEVGPSKAADAWLETARARHAPPIVATLGEAIVIVAGARVASPERLAGEAPALRERLRRSGALGALADLGSGLPAALATDLPVRFALRVRADAPAGPQPEAAPPALREDRRTLVCRDARDGRELWRYPPPGFGASSRLPGPPLLLCEGGAWFVVLPWAGDLLVIHARQGVVWNRTRLWSAVPALLPAGEREVLAVLSAEGGRARSRLLPCTAARALEPAPPAGIPWSRGASHREVVNGSDERSAGDPARCAEELARVATLRARDPGNPHAPGLAATRLAALGRGEEAAAEVQRLLEADLSPLELTQVAETLDERGLPREADRLLERAVAVHAGAGLNADLSPLLLGSPVVPVRKVMRRAAERGEEDRVVRLGALARELATVVEGDAVTLAIERRWLQARGRRADVEALAPYEARADRLGGLFLTPHGLVESFDPALALQLVLPCVVALTLGAVWLRARHTQRADLRALGFRTWGSRLLGFATNPLLRLSHTILAYATREQRAVLVAAAGLFLVSNAYLEAVVIKIGELAALPMTIGNGDLGHPTARELVAALADEAPRGRRAPHQRLLAEGALLRGDAAAARQHLDELAALSPDDPFALTNLGLLREAAGERDAALALHRRAAAAPGDEGWPGRQNLARLEGRAPADEPVPAPYRGLRRLDPANARPVRQLASCDDLTAVLAVVQSPWRAAIDRLARAPLGVRGASLLGTFQIGDGGAGETSLAARLERLVRTLAPVVFLFALLHLPFGVRSSGPPPTEPGRLARWLGRAAAALDLAWPGLRWTIHGRAVGGAGLLVLVPLLLVLVSLGKGGGLLLNIAFPATVLPFGELAEGDFIVSRALRFLSSAATLGLVVIYAATWLGALWRLVRWRRGAPTRPAPAP